MKYLLFVIFICLCSPDLFAQSQDTVKVETLPEVMVNSDNQIETARKVVLLPSALERKHAINGLELLSVMNTPELEVDTYTRKITTKSGGSVVVCINGMEVANDEVVTLRAKNIKSIEYVRTPTGKYVGKAGVLNFITIQYKYGGNAYVSAEEGFAYRQGKYRGYVDYTRKGLTLSLTTTFD